MLPEFDRLLNLYERGGISRRALLEGVALLALGSAVSGQTRPSAAGEPLVRARTLNHVTLVAADVAKSKAFYERLTGLAIRDEGKDFCEFRLEGSFLGIYAREAEEAAGFNHFCLGIDGYDAKRLVGQLKQAIPEADATLEYDSQVYVRDPDGVKVQFADVNYKH